LTANDILYIESLFVQLGVEPDGVSHVLMVEILARQKLQPAARINEYLAKLRASGKAAFLFESSYGTAAYNVLLRLYKDKRLVEAAVVAFHDMLNRCVDGPCAPLPTAISVSPGR
jgi:hypothetical protein